MTTPTIDDSRTPTTVPTRIFPNLSGMPPRDLSRSRPTERATASSGWSAGPWFPARPT